MDRRRAGGRVAALGALLIVTLAACGGTSQASPSAAAPTTAATAAPSATAAATATPAPSPSPSGPTAFTSTAFDQPFAITLPAGWVVGDQAADMSSFFLPMGPDQGPRLGVDIQEVSKVLQDPCDPGSVDIDPGASAGDLATWMGTWAPLHASAPGAAKISGLDAITVEEAFDGTPCANANLWPTSGGYLDPGEHKRYAILEVGGKRVVVTLVGRDDTWDSTLADGQKVLDSLTFANP